MSVQPADDEAQLAAFAASLHSLASAWDERDPQRAADLFTQTAIYSEQTLGRVFRGRDELIKHFARAFEGGGWMRLVWRHITFDARSEVGAGEFSFYWPAGQVHGMVSVRMERGRIANWREYAIVSDLDWDAFQGANRF
jgi:N12 class adenine-specific DNA methylase